MFREVVGYDTWQRIEPIDKGWSSDKKFYIETIEGEKLVLRVADRASYDEKKCEYEIICKYAELDFEMSKPVAFGICNEGESVYMLLTWIEGEELGEVLPSLSEEMQYKLGCEAGRILKQIHSQTILDEALPKGTKVPKKQLQIQCYKESSIRIPEDEVALAFVKINLYKIATRRPVYQHGDFHPGNLILTPQGKVGVIDFNRWEIGDPYEEFYKLESFGVERSIPYCRGQIDTYFEGNVPDVFWEVLAVYVAHASLYSIKWAEKFGQDDIDGMVVRCRQAFLHYDGFKNTIPSWYRESE